MANGIDDEPSGAQAYFTTAPPRDQQQSRPEDDQIAGNDREGLFYNKSYVYEFIVDIEINVFKN